MARSGNASVTSTIEALIGESLTLGHSPAGISSFSVVQEASWAAPPIVDGASRTHFGESTTITVGSTWTSSSDLDDLERLSLETSRLGVVPS